MGLGTLVDHNAERERSEKRQSCFDEIRVHLDDCGGGNRANAARWHCHDCPHALAALVHLGVIAISPFVRLLPL